jgi:hypothetical protein
MFSANARTYLPNYMQFTTESVGCGNAGTTVYMPSTITETKDEFEDAHKAMLKFIAFLDPASIKQSWQIQKAIGFASQHQLISDQLVCSGSEAPQACEIVAPSDTVFDLQDAGENKEDVLDGLASERLQQKDVVFVPFNPNVANPCDPLDVSVSVQTVRSQPAAAKQYVRWFPVRMANDLKEPENVWNLRKNIMRVSTPSISETNLFQMCQRYSNEPTAKFTLVTSCVYRFGPAATCGTPNCGRSDFSPSNSGSWIDRFYFSAIVHSTVGLGDVVMLSLRTKCLNFLEALLITIVATI